MFGTKRSGANAYANVGVETGVMAASPHKLITMLFEGAIAALSAFAYNGADGAEGAGMRQTAAAQNAEIVVDSVKISKPTNTVTDAIQGVTLNLSNSPESVREVITLLADLKGAWESISPTNAVHEAAAPVAPAPAQGYDNLALRNAAFASA